MQPTKAVMEEDIKKQATPYSEAVCDTQAAHPNISISIFGP